MDVGAELQQAREQRGLSLQDLSHRTKIRLPILRAIENNDTKQLPKGIFTRGFLQAYAREVGLDPAQIWQRYAAQFEPPAEDPERPADKPVPEAAPAANAGQRGDDRRPLTAYRVERDRVIPVIAALALVAVSYFLFTRWHGGGPPNHVASSVSRDNLAASSHSPAPPAPAVRATTGSSAATASSVGRLDVLRVDLQPRGVCWVSATADGNRVTYRLMNAGDRQTIEVQNELVLRVGEPSNLGFSINGSPGRPLGRPGQPTTVRITRQNYERFVAR